MKTLSNEPSIRITPPALLKPGDWIRVVAPAGPFDRTLFFRGLSWLRTHFRVHAERSLFARHRYLAGSDEHRRRALDEAFACQKSRAIVAARGGFGAARIVDQLDWERFRSHPKWLVGYSDITSLLVAAAQQGVASLHAHNVTGLGVGSAAERQRWLDALTRPLTPTVHDLETLYPGEARGPLVGGNLTVLASRCGGPGASLPPRSILFLEEIGESPYRLDRSLTQLKQAGVFQRVSGVVSGYFTGCDSPRQGWRAHDVLGDFARELCIPWLGGLKAGHQFPNTPLHLGLVAHLSPGRLVLAAEY